jgi:hypothetical protein
VRVFAEIVAGPDFTVTVTVCPEEAVGRMMVTFFFGA